MRLVLVLVMVDRVQLVVDTVQRVRRRRYVTSVLLRFRTAAISSRNGRGMHRGFGRERLVHGGLACCAGGHGRVRDGWVEEWGWVVVVQACGGRGGGGVVEGGVVEEGGVSRCGGGGGRW